MIDNHFVLLRNTGGYMAIFLFFIGLLLIIINIRPEHKDKIIKVDPKGTSIEKNIKLDSSFKDVYENTESKITPSQIEIIKLRNEVADTFLELQKDIENINNKVDKMLLQNQNSSINKKLKSNVKLDKISKSEKTEKAEINYDVNIEKEKKSQKKNEIRQDYFNAGVRIEDIQNLIKSGLSDDEISKKLQVSKGEILLIKELYLK